MSTDNHSAASLECYTFPLLKMAYTRERLKETIRVFRSAKAVAHQQHRASPQLDRSLRNKHDFRGQGPPSPGTQASRWQQEDSDADDDDDYDPTAKRRQKKQVERSAHPKRKAAEAGDEAKERKKRIKSTPRCSTLEELSDKISFLTFTITSQKGKDLLKELSEQHETGLQGRRPACSALADASMDTWTWEKERRKTYEQQFEEQIDEIDNSGGRALRSRKVPEIEVEARKPKAMARNHAEIEPQETKAFATHKHHEDEYSTRLPHGLPSPAPTPPEFTNRSRQSHSIQEPTKHDIIEISPSPSPTPECRLEWITTRWAHPIDFTYIPSAGQPPCHFCEKFRYGIAGFRARDIQVQKTGDANKMYEEYRGGRPNPNPEATRMCAKCALDRIYISKCATHQLQVLPGLDPVAPGIGPEKIRTYVQQIMYGKAIEDNQPIHPVCSLCACPALYRCCAAQAKDRLGALVAPGRTLKGCGLLICAECEEMLRDYNGVLKKRFLREHLYEVKVKGKERQMRADHEFLFKGSLLHQAWGSF